MMEYAESKIATLVEEIRILKDAVAEAERKPAYALSSGRPFGAYLASPYSDPDPDVRARRYYYAVAGVAALYKAEPAALHFSPIVHSHPILQYAAELRDLKWVELDMALLRCCKKVVVLQVEGWDSSEGIKCEIAEAERCGIPVEYMTIS